MQLLSHRLVILLLADVALVQHLIQDQLLTVLVPLDRGPHLPLAVGHPGQGVGPVPGGVVGDGNEAGALSQGQIRHGLVKVPLCRRTHTLTAGPQRDHVQVVEQDGILVILLLQLQSPEDLGHLPLDGSLIFLGDILNHLLGNGGSALNIPTGEHAEHRLGRAPPVHAVVGVEPAVLNGHRRILQILGNFVKFHPLGAGGAQHLPQLLVLPVRILVVHDAVFVQVDAGQIQIRIGQNGVADVHRRKAAHKSSGGNGHQQNGANDPQSGAAAAASPLLPAAPVLGRGAAAGVRVTAGAGPGFVLGRIGRIVSLRHRISLRIDRAPEKPDAPKVHGFICLSKIFSGVLFPPARKNQYILYHILPICPSWDFTRPFFFLFKV